MLNIDFHSHSVASHHAMNTVDELLRQADQNGMAGLAITDHSPGIDNTLWLMKNCGEGEAWKQLIKGPDSIYFRSFTARYQPPAEYKVKLFKGIECNITDIGPTACDVPLDISGRFDIVIASIHPLPSLIRTLDRDHLTGLLLAAMDEPIDIIGHPFEKGCAPYPEVVVPAAVEKGITLEVNNSFLKYGKADRKVVLESLTLAKKHGCRISISSDAHATNEVGNDDAIRQILSEVQFPEELIVNQNLPAAMAFVTKRREIRDKAEQL